MIQTPLTLDCAEKTPHYLPKPLDPKWAEARRIAEDVKKTKQQNPQLGTGIYDHLVDALINNTLALAQDRQGPPEPINWTPPQRCVWRSATKVPENIRYQIVEDVTVSRDTKAFAIVRQGRWLTLCPFPGCNGAQKASYTARRFWCVDCCNLAVGGRWIEVVWPDDPCEVERWLVGRSPSAKNWDAGEGRLDIVKQDAEYEGIVNATKA